MYHFLDKCLSIIVSESKVVAKSIEWMSSDDFNLRTKASAALIVANIARTGMLVISSIIIIMYVSGVHTCTHVNLRFR